MATRTITITLTDPTDDLYNDLLTTTWSVTNTATRGAGFPVSHDGDESLSKEADDLWKRYGRDTQWSTKPRLDDDEDEDGPRQ